MAETRGPMTDTGISLPYSQTTKVTHLKDDALTHSKVADKDENGKGIHNDTLGDDDNFTDNESDVAFTQLQKKCDFFNGNIDSGDDGSRQLHDDEAVVHNAPHVYDSLVDFRRISQAVAYKMVDTSGSEHHLPGKVAEKKTFVDINDYTDYTYFFHQLYVYTFQVVDTVLWGLITCLTLSVFMVIGSISWVFQKPFISLTQVIAGYFGGRPQYFESDPAIKNAKDARGKHKQVLMSWVNVMSPNIHSEDDYREKLDQSSFPSSAPNAPTLNKELAALNSFDNKVPGKRRRKISPFSYGIAKFFLHLSALVYEEPEVFAHFMNKWDLEYVFGNVSSKCVCAIVYSVEHNWIVCVFKGTSPFNLSEWLIDAVLSKVRPSSHFEGRLPGMVHQGFYEALGFPMDYELGVSSNDSIVWPALNIRRSLIQIADTIKATNRHRNVPRLWITGHSLGAALAQMFTAHLSYNCEHLGMTKNFSGATNSLSDQVSKQIHHPIGRLLMIKGCYTFGTPKIGDRVFSSCINSLYFRKGIASYRIINSNDIVCRVPIGAIDTTNLLKVVHQVNCAICQLPESQFPSSYGNSPLDFARVGRCLSLQYSGCPRAIEGDIVLFIRGLMGYCERTMMGPWRYLTNFFQMKREDTMLGVTMAFCTPFFLKDHFPSEYLRHINLAAEHDKENLAMIVANIQTFETVINLYGQNE